MYKSHPTSYLYPASYTPTVCIFPPYLHESPHYPPISNLSHYNFAKTLSYIKKNFLDPLLKWQFKSLKQFCK